MRAADSLELVSRARTHRNRTAVVAREGEFTYGDLLDASARVASCILGGENDLREARVAFLAPPGFDYVATQWGIWRAGGVAVPLCAFYPRPELEYVVRDSDAGVVVARPEFCETVRPVAEGAGARVILTADAVAAAPAGLPAVDESRRAMILYTSGTTGRPKGVVTTHANIRAQVTSLVEAWGWTAEDRILHVLPLHHIHGIVNVLTCAFYSGATCEIMPGFDARAVWGRISEGGLSLFMAVPTIYVRLIAAWEAASPDERSRMSRGSAGMRLMVSGSAALPVGVLKKWHEITGHVLLERYGMTETGMALSNPLRGERRPGSVGTPLPRVELRLVDEAGRAAAPGEPGEIEIRGPGVFLEYWRNPGATAEAFREGWFRTGDIAVLEDGAFRLLGRSSVDIIKTGGYKVSALEIEEVLRTHGDIVECAVVGLPDPEWGERVCAALVLGGEGGGGMDLASLRRWCKKRLAPYKAPTRMLVLDELPRNAMGKVSKAKLAEMF